MLPHFKRPMSHFKASGELKQAAPTYFTTTPDVDNVTKFVLDALQPAVLKDDKFVVLCSFRVSTEQLFTFRKITATMRRTSGSRLSWWRWMSENKI